MKTILFLDENSVTGYEGVKFGLNKAKKHPENPVLLPGEPHQWDSLQVAWPGTVLYNEKEKKFRCWYTGMDAIQTPIRWWKQGYAESTDGIHWVKPELGQVTFLDKPTNRINADDWNPDAFMFISFVFENPLPDFPDNERFCCYWFELGHDEDGIPLINKSRKTLAYSPDGVKWTRACAAYDPEVTDQNPFLDLCQIIYDPDDSDPDMHIKMYSQICGASRSWDGKKVRQIGFAHGSHFNHVDAADLVVLAPEEGIDEELHFASVIKIDDNYLMLFESDRFSKNPIHGDLRLAVSKNGMKFQRIHKLTPLVETGSRGMWDENLLVSTTNSIQMVGDEVYIYYFGCPNVYNSWPGGYAVDFLRRGSLLYPSYIGLATLPRDRFAYVEGPGSMETESIEINDTGLWINAEGDDLSVKAIDMHGNEAARGCMSNERQNTVYRKIYWDRALPSVKVSLQIALGIETKIFSLRY